MSSGGQRYDVVIAGGGTAGLTLACALSDTLGPDARIAVADPAPLHAGGAPDARAFALSAGAKRMLSVLGVWPGLAAHAQPVTAIEITDSALEDAFRPVLVSYDNTVDGGEPATYIVEHGRLRDALLAAAADRRGVALCGGEQAVAFHVDEHGVDVDLGRGPAERRTLRAALLVAADGRTSPLREMAGIGVVRWSYPQIGIVTTVRLEQPHRSRAVQHFLPSGPFAILPLTQDRACITWTEDAIRAREILALDDAGFLAEVEKRFGYRLGGIALTGPRASWPLDMHLARALIADRFALLGDAAHGVHPIAGQGLNLGLRDVAALTEVVADAARLGLDIGSLAVLERYERWRRLDSALSATTFDALNRLFSSDSTLLRSARDFGLGLVERLPGLKQFFVAEAAGLTGDVPRLLRGEPA
jgi:2-octaprenyl-6-methoxyphenol hydroxylase